MILSEWDLDIPRDNRFHDPFEKREEPRERRQSGPRMSDIERTVDQVYDRDKVRELEREIELTGDNRFRGWKVDV